MVRMENYYSLHDRLQELWQEIDKCHLLYLGMEDSPEKIDQRLKLEDYIHDFLCLAVHCDKFTFTETEEVLQKSASQKRDFSAYKAATGFNAIQLYAGNLLSQPWRREYRQIRTYCGFYKHQIEANLVGAELIFEALGYTHFGNGLLVLNGPISLERVAAVSRDCLIAYVECQILKAIWEEVSSSFKISWLEVLEFRKTHVCTPEQSVKRLTYKHHQRQYQEHTRSYSQGCDPFPNTLRQTVPAPNLSPVLSTNHSYPPLSSHHLVGLPTPPAECLYINGCCPNSSYGTYGQAYPPYMPYAQALIKPQLNTNGYYYNGIVPPQHPGYQHAVPTAKLIEVESHNGLAYDMVDKANHKPRNPEPIHNELYKNKNNNDAPVKPHDRDSDKNDSQFEDWDYVYRNLESQGYSKDLGERGDLLSPNSPKQPKEVKKVKSTNLDEALNNLTINERPLKPSESWKKVERGNKIVPEVSRIDKETSPCSSYDNLNPADELKKPISKTTSVPVNAVASFSKTKSLPRDKNSSLIEKQLQSKTLDMRKLKEEKTNIKKKEVVVSPERKLNADRWECKACTYINDNGKDICEMCSKTRGATTEPHMEIGGAECSQCTLVNPKNLKQCEACGASLKDSPTYI